MARKTKAEIAAEIAALQAQLAQDETGVYEDANGRFYVRFPVTGKWTTRRVAPDGSPLLTRDQAVAARALWVEGTQRNAVTRGRTRFGDYWEHYLRHAKAEMVHGSWVAIRADGIKRLLPTFESMLLTKITVPVIRDWRATMLEQVEAGDFAAKTVNNSRIALMGCLRMAVGDGLIPFNPVPDVKPLQIAYVERDFLRIHEIAAYEDACARHYRDLARFLLGTGVRVSEAIAVKINDLDLHTGQVSVTKQLDSTTGKLRETKGRNRRTVVIGPGLVDRLRDMLAVRREHAVDDGGWLFLCPPPRRGRYAGRTLPQPPHRKTVHDWHEAALSDAGLRDMPLHGLRHTAAAAWLGTGRSLEFVRAQLGHSSTKVTSDYYGHLEDQFRAEGAADTEARIRDARSLGLTAA